MASQNHTTLKIRFPYNGNGTNMAERIKAFEAFFYNAFHLFVRAKEKVACEIVLVDGIMNFYISTEESFAQSVVSFLYAAMPDVHVAEVDAYDHLEDIGGSPTGFYVRLIGSESTKLRTTSQTHTDPLSPFFYLLSALPSHDAVLYQIVLLPINELFDATRGFYGSSEKTEAGEVTPKFQTTIRLLHYSKDKERREAAESALMNIFSPFATERNYLEVQPAKNASAFVRAFADRSVEETNTLTSEEIASLFHAPDPEAKVRGVNWLFSRKGEPPMNLPTEDTVARDELCLLGETNFQGHAIPFGMLREDRRRHLYVVGKSGSGKSKLLEKLIIDDISAGHGVCVIDPHGDLVQAVLHHIPKQRVKDVVYVNPADIEFPVAFNPLENVGREYKQQVTHGMIEIFKKFFGADWTPKIEHVFRFTVLALLDYKKSTIMGMQKMLTDRAYRQKVVADIRDHVVQNFWMNEFASWSERFDSDAIIPLVNKLGQFLSNEMVRNIVSQATNKLDFHDILNNERILLVELSKGRLGEENSSLLGSLIITKIEQEGMARAAMAEEDRKDFYVYVDEFQNFSTKSFDHILAEARKYRLNVTVSHQFLGQLMPSTRETIFGNVGSIMTFRLSADDAKYMAQEFAPRFSANDIMNLSVRDMYVKMSVGGIVTPPFSARTMDVPTPDPEDDMAEEAIATSRKRYTTPLAEVEREIAETFVVKKEVVKPEGEQFAAPMV